ncbi:kinesin light chain [Podospora fimiseda]|uniref:Kinesin light chain n=1 Tax=Podospora fimiseda TaxID=252190 RepID=A0AAN6YQS6_9PEZI|nr:kinesin light chain [Podospora fimiseda]
MDQGESKQLLQEKLEDDGLDPEDLSTLSSPLEHLPQALVQAAAFIHEKTISVSRYLQLLNESDQNFVHLLSNEFETVGRDSEAPRAVAETWILSFEQIRRIPHEFLSDYAKQKQELELRGEMQLVEALGVLKAFSFIATSQAVLTVSHIYPYGSYDNWVICSNYLPHVYAVLNIAATESDDEKLGRAALLRNTGGYFLYKGEWKEAEAFLIKAIEIRKTILKADHPSTLTSMANLASTYRNQGRWEEAEKVEVKVLGKQHPETLISMSCLASVLDSQGKYEEAEQIHRQALHLREKVLGKEHADTLTSFSDA